MLFLKYFLKLIDDGCLGCTCIHVQMYIYTCTVLIHVLYMHTCTVHVRRVYMRYSMSPRAW